MTGLAADQTTKWQVGLIKLLYPIGVFETEKQSESKKLNMIVYKWQLDYVEKVTHTIVIGLYEITS